LTPLTKILRTFLDTAANPPHAAAAINKWETDRHCTVSINFVCVLVLQCFVTVGLASERASNLEN